MIFTVDARRVLGSVFPKRFWVGKPQIMCVDYLSSSRKLVFDHECDVTQSLDDAVERSPM